MKVKEEGVLCTTVASGGKHKQVGLYNPWYGQKIEVDEGMTSILGSLWGEKIDTLMSCENCHGGLVWVSFTLQSFGEFMDLVATNKELFALVYKMQNNYYGCKYYWNEDPEGGEVSRVRFLSDIDGYEEHGRVEFEVQMRFPIMYKQRFEELLLEVAEK